jgi:hypothetical protein
VNGKIGGGIGVACGVLVVAAGRAFGLGDIESEAAALVIVGSFGWLGHALGKIWKDPGLLPWFRRGLRGRNGKG